MLTHKYQLLVRRERRAEGSTDLLLLSHEGSVLQLAFSFDSSLDPGSIFVRVKVLSGYHGGESGFTGLRIQQIGKSGVRSSFRT